jgi:uncharacterized LabA/DUF88 family protein
LLEFNAMADRSIIYIDGFNLYYGALKGGPYKWLDIEHFFRLLRKDDDIQKIRYYTALVAGPAQARQKVFLKALDTLPLVEVSLGRFKARQTHCRVAACTHPGRRIFQMPEEKRTDVNIAVDMLDDAYQDLCDRLVVVSGDSDLVPVVNRVKANFPQKHIIVYVPSRDPTRGAAVELRSAADKHRTLPLALLRPSQFPAMVPDGSPGGIQKPAEW